MHRRSVLAVSASVVAAGCSELPSSLGGGGGPNVDASVSQGNNVQFTANEGDELEISVEVEEIDEGEADQGSGDVESRSVSVRINHVEDNSEFLLAESVEGEATFTETVPLDGEYNIAVGNGKARILIEQA